MNDLEPSSNSEFRQCFKCNHEAVTDQVLCPRCGKKVFFTSGSIRRRGIVALLSGLFIAGLMTAVAIFVATLILGQMNDPAAARKIVDEQYVFLAIFGFFGLLIAMGIHFVVTGGWMAVFGKRNRVLIWVMWAFLFVVLVAAGFLTAFLP